MAALTTKRVTMKPARNFLRSKADVFMATIAGSIVVDTAARVAVVVVEVEDICVDMVVDIDVLVLEV